MHPRWTAIITASILPVLGLADFVFAVVGGNEATISAVLLRIRAKFPMVAKCVSYSFGLFLGHVFNPTDSVRVPAGHEMLSRLMLAFGPIGYAIIMIAANDGANPDADITTPRNRLLFGFTLLGYIAIGLAVGSTWLAQHPHAWDKPK